MSAQATSQCCPGGIVQPMETRLPPHPLCAREQEAPIAGHGRLLPTPRRICRDKAVLFPTFWTWNVCRIFAAWFPVSLGGEIRMIFCTPPPLVSNAGFLVCRMRAISMLSPMPGGVGSAPLGMLPSTAIAMSQVFWMLPALPLQESRLVFLEISCRLRWGAQVRCRPKRALSLGHHGPGTYLSLCIRKIRASLKVLIRLVVLAMETRKLETMSFKMVVGV